VKETIELASFSQELDLLFLANKFECDLLDIISLIQYHSRRYGMPHSQVVEILTRCPRRPKFDENGGIRMKSHGSKNR
jgi:hypothetical protein